MRIHILSDLHLEVADFVMPEIESDVLILAGDICAPGRHAIEWVSDPMVRRGRHVLFVAGNHELYGSVYQKEMKYMKSLADSLLINFLDRTSVVIDGIRFLGCTLWTDFNLRIRVGPNDWRTDRTIAMQESAKYMRDYSTIRYQDVDNVRVLTPQDTLKMHEGELAWLREQFEIPFNGQTIVITHHAPSTKSCEKRFEDDWCSAAFLSGLPESLFEVPVLWVHGHTHSRHDYKVCDCRVVCNPRGYVNWRGPEVDDFDPGLVVDIGAIC